MRNRLSELTSGICFKMIPWVKKMGECLDFKAVSSHPLGIHWAFVVCWKPEISPKNNRISSLSSLLAYLTALFWLLQFVA